MGLENSLSSETKGGRGSNVEGDALSSSAHMPAE